MTISLRFRRRLGSTLIFTVVGCSSGIDETPSRSEVVLGGQCEVTIECARGLHCTALKCAEPTTPTQEHAVEVAKIERKIAATHKHEAAAFTEDGKRRMRAQRADLQEKLAEAKASAGVPPR